MPRCVWTIVVAGGSGARFGSLKQFEELGGRRVIDWCVEAAEGVSDGIVVVVPADHGDTSTSAHRVVVGGSTRSESVRCGLAAVPTEADVIVVHDGARPFAGTELFRAVVDAVTAGADGAVPAVAVTDTIKQITADSVVVTTPERAALVAVQTPQAFAASWLRRAHESGKGSTDDAALVEAIGGHVVVVAGDGANRKITLADDLTWARSRAER